MNRYRSGKTSKNYLKGVSKMANLIKVKSEIIGGETTLTTQNISYIRNILKAANKNELCES